MTPNAVIAGQYGSLAQLETFFMTNMCPQHEDLNQRSWQQLEKFVIAAAEKLDHVFVIVGPIFGDDPEVTAIEPGRGIQVPDAFYMILVDLSFEFRVKPRVKMMACRFAQDTPADADFKDRNKFGVSINEIEEQTQLDFFPAYGAMFANWEDREDEVEMTHWTLD